VEAILKMTRLNKARLPRNCANRMCSLAHPLRSSSPFLVENRNGYAYSALHTTPAPDHRHRYSISYSSAALAYCPPLTLPLAVVRDILTNFVEH
jgi:hypothetical protein